MALGADLYARDVESYRRLAGQIVSDKVGRPQLSDNLAKIATRFFVPLLDHYDADRPSGTTELTPFGTLSRGSLAKLFAAPTRWLAQRIGANWILRRPHS